MFGFKAFKDYQDGKLIDEDGIIYPINEYIQHPINDITYQTSLDALILTEIHAISKVHAVVLIQYQINNQLNRYNTTNLQRARRDEF